MLDDYIILQRLEPGQEVLVIYIEAFQVVLSLSTEIRHHFSKVYDGPVELMKLPYLFD